MKPFSSRDCKAAWYTGQTSGVSRSDRADCNGEYQTAGLNAKKPG
jgi:hypothetical protein